MTNPLRLATGTAEVLASLRRSLAGDGLTAPLPAAGPERAQTRDMLASESTGFEIDAGAIVATSGSTGHPRGVLLPRSALLASAQATHARLGGPGRWVLALPPHYVAGLMVLVRALVAGQPVHEVGARLSGLPDLDLGGGPAYVSLVPTQLARALADPALARALIRFDAVLLGGAAADPELLNRAGSAGVRVVTTYGMSETCGGCVYDGRPLDGVQVDVAEDGRIGIGGPTLFAGYRLDPAATSAALVAGRLITRDRGAWVDGRLTVLGRVDDVVVSGGMNVDLAAVERAVRTWAGGEASVVGVPDPDWGVEVTAVMDSENLPHHGRVPREPGSAEAPSGRFSESPRLLTAVRTALADDLPAYALPRRLLTGRLPRTSGGKIDRRRLVADLTRTTQQPETS